MSTLPDPSPSSPAGRQRTRALSLLRHADRPLSVTEVAKAMDLHANTARFHLEGLVEDGLAERATEPREAPGRPRILYSSEGPPPGPRNFALLAEMLTGLVASLDGAGSSTVEMGRAWGRHLVERAAPSEHVDADEAIGRLTQLLDAVGFQSEVHPGEQSTEVHLHHCPFREVAQKHPDVVCTIHLGLMQGALDELRAPLSVTSLDPFVTPNVCIGRLDPTPAAS